VKKLHVAEGTAQCIKDDCQIPAIQAKLNLELIRIWIALAKLKAATDLGLQRNIATSTTDDSKQTEIHL
jgi:hypothetical protein